MVGAAGFEPTTTSPPDWCATRLRHAPTNPESSTRGGCDPPEGSDLAIGLQTLDPAAVVRQFVLGFAGQQVDHAALDALALEQGAGNLAGDRHVDAVAFGQGES